MSLRFDYVVACDRVFFFFKAAQYSIVCMHYIFFIHSSVKGYLGCFQLLAIVNHIAMNRHVQISL